MLNKTVKANQVANTRQQMRTAIVELQTPEQKARKRGRPRKTPKIKAFKLKAHNNYTSTNLIDNQPKTINQIILTIDNQSTIIDRFNQLCKTSMLNHIIAIVDPKDAVKQRQLVEPDVDSMLSNDEIHDAAKLTPSLLLNSHQTNMTYQLRLLLRGCSSASN